MKITALELKNLFENPQGGNIVIKRINNDFIWWNTAIPVFIQHRTLYTRMTVEEIWTQVVKQTGYHPRELSRSRFPDSITLCVEQTNNPLLPTNTTLLVTVEDTPNEPYTAKLVWTGRVFEITADHRPCVWWTGKESTHQHEDLYYNRGWASSTTVDQHRQITNSTFDPHEYLNYNPETGEFTWRKLPKRHSQNGRPGTTYRNTLRICIAGRIYDGGRLAYFMTHGIMPNKVKYKNGDKLDLRIDNIVAVGGV